MSIRAVLFDFDGTLADSFGAITASTNHVRAKYGLPALTEREVRRHVGFGLPQLLNDLVPGAPTDEAVDCYRSHHLTVMASGTHLFAGVSETLAALHARGLALAVCSNKRVDMTRKLVAILGVAGYFKLVLGPEDVGKPKPDPAMVREALDRLSVPASQAVYVGDMSVDVETARAAGVPVWLVPDGAGDRQIAEAARPDRVLRAFTDLLELLPTEHKHEA